MYTTTPDFLELFGLKSLESLPDLEEFRELEGLRDPAEATPTASPADSPQGTISESPGEPEPAGQSILNETLGDSPTTNADEIIGEASSPLTVSEDAGSSTENDEPESENNDGPEDSHSRRKQIARAVARLLAGTAPRVVAFDSGRRRPHIEILNWMCANH
jgi:hypothetical protein